MHNDLSTEEIKKKSNNFVHHPFWTIDAKQSAAWFQSDLVMHLM